MSSAVTANLHRDYPIAKPWQRGLRLVLWIVSIIILSVASVWFNFGGGNVLDSSLVAGIAYYLGAFILLFLLAWLLHTTPINAIKLPTSISNALIAVLALIIWLAQWHGGFSPSQAVGGLDPIAQYLFCSLQIGATILALFFLHLAKRSPWWACLPLLTPRYDILSGSFATTVVWTPLMLDLILAALICWLMHKKLAGLICLSFVAGLFPPALLLFPLLYVRAPSPAYPSPRRPPVLMLAAAILPMTVLWVCFALWPVTGVNPWLWTTAIEPRVSIHASTH